MVDKLKLDKQNTGTDYTLKENHCMFCHRDWRGVLNLDWWFFRSDELLRDTVWINLSQLQEVNVESDLAKMTLAEKSDQENNIFHRSLSSSSLMKNPGLKADFIFMKNTLKLN